MRTGQPDDKYGMCVRFPKSESKHDTIDWCGEFQHAKSDVLVQRIPTCNAQPDVPMREPKPEAPPLRTFKEGDSLEKITKQKK